MCNKEGVGAYMTKSAFRHLPIRPEDRRWLIMKATNPLDNKTYFFVEKCVSLGSSISCSHFKRVPNAIAYIFQKQTGKKTKNYLDDFFFIALRQLACNNLIRSYIKLCETINFPLSMEKTEWATQIIVFPGMLLNTLTQTISIPVEKRDKALYQLCILLESRKVTVHQAQKLAGLLNHLFKALVPGKALNRRFYSKIAGLKQHHHLRVEREMKMDASTWVSFLKNNNESLCRPFIDLATTLQADIIEFFSDASGKIGLGAIFSQRRMHATWKTKGLVSNTWNCMQ